MIRGIGARSSNIRHDSYPKQEITHADLIAVLELNASRDAFIVEKGAVSAANVGQRDTPFGNLDSAMLFADEIAGQPDLAVGITTDKSPPILQRNLNSSGISAQDNEGCLHRASPEAVIGIREQV